MLQSLEATVETADCQIILVDDCSTDDTPALLDSLANRENVTVIRNETNLGFSGSNNRGAAAAMSETLVFLNNDLVLTQGWLDPMIEGLETLPEAGAVGNVQRNFATGLVDHAGIFFDLDGMPTHAHKNRANPPKGKWIERNAVTAACLAIRKSVFDEVGGFDEGYRNGCEDVDLCMKLRQSGYRLYVSLESIIGHHVSSSPGRNNHNDANSLRFRERWSDFSKTFGQTEWPIEYLRRYARFWWRMNPSLFAKALIMLAKR